MSQEFDEASTVLNEKSDASDPEMPYTRIEPPIRSLVARPPGGNAIDTAIKGTVMFKIESIFEAMVDVLLKERGQLFLVLTSRSGSQRPQGIMIDTHSPTRHAQHICFPGRDENEAWRLAVVTRILELIHEAMRNDVTISKRDIYYRDPALFGRQSNVDKYVDTIACTFGVPRSALQVTAAAKGLVAGALSFCRRNGDVVDASGDIEGVLVPNMNEILSINVTRVEWILVIEKEATFRSIAASDAWKTLSTHGIMITAKGYPDIATRSMLSLLSNPSPRNGFRSPPVHGMMDFDPDGIAIYSTYKHGSKCTAHEPDELQLPQMKWLGLSCDHMLRNADSCAEQGLLTLSSRDRKKAQKMLEWKALANEDDLQTSLRSMLMLNLKGELQILDAVPDGMSNLLRCGLPKREVSWV